MVNLGGTQKVDFLGTCFGGAGLGLHSWGGARLRPRLKAKANIEQG